MFFGMLKVVPTDPDTPPPPSMPFLRMSNVEVELFPTRPGLSIYYYRTTRLSSRRGVPKPASGLRQ